MLFEGLLLIFKLLHTNLYLVLNISYLGHSQLFRQLDSCELVLEIIVKFFLEFFKFVIIDLAELRLDELAILQLLLFLHFRQTFLRIHCDLL